MRTYKELLNILEHDDQYEDQQVIEAIDDMILTYYDHLKSKDKIRVSEALLDIKWSKHKEYPTIYDTNTPPYAGIYADVIMWKGFWPAQQQFGKIKTPYLLNEYGQVPK